MRPTVVAAVEAAKELGPLRVLVNCAGIGWPQRTIGKDIGWYSLEICRNQENEYPKEWICK